MATSTGSATALAFMLLAPAAVWGQDPGAQTVVQVRLVNEVRADRANPDGIVAAAGSTWNTFDFGLATLDASWTSGGGRLRVGGAVALFGDTNGDNVSVRVREGYARLSAASWLDVEAGKRILKWGTGYAFTPTGVLDPPRNPADPNDRLGTNEGTAFVGAHLFRGNTALSIVGASPDTWRSPSPGVTTPHWEAAAKLRTLVRGVEVAVVGSAADTSTPSWGVNFTHVVGQNLEWHGELLMHRPVLPVLPPGVASAPAGGREVSALIGCQYTFNVGVNVVLEYYHDANGFDRATWLRLTSVLPLLARADILPGTGTSPAAGGPTTALPGLRNFGFLRAAPAATEPRLLPELLAIAGLDDGSLTLVPGLTWTAQRHVQVYARGTVLTGRAGSVARLAASKGELQVGVAARF